MRRLILTAAFLVLTIVSSAQAPVRPNFSGEWVPDLTTKPQVSGSPITIGPLAGGVPGGIPQGSTSRGAGAPPDGPVRVGGEVAPPQMIKRVEPVYPREAMNARIEGTVILEAALAKDGTVKDVRVLRSIPGLDDAALAAVRQWQYSPAQLGGVPVEALMTVAVNFTLTGASAGMPPSAGAGGGGVGLSGAPGVIIVQDKDTLKVTSANSTDVPIVYRFDGTESMNGPIRYVSRWDGDRLVTTITPPEGQKLAAMTQTMSLDGAKLVIEMSSPGATKDAPPRVVRLVYVKKR